MQTFLPYPSVDETVRCLDYRRLGKQRVEADQILTTLIAGKGGWQNHPAVKMWKGHEEFLAYYRDQCIAEWVRRGYRNTMVMALDPNLDELPTPPEWFGDPRFHASHRSNLLRKDFKFYSQYGWAEPADLPYLWPR